ncbi:hypothetical protein EJB05_36605, partial [Eragrostis curvula]
MVNGLNRYEKKKEQTQKAALHPAHGSAAIAGAATSTAACATTRARPHHQRRRRRHRNARTAPPPPPEDAPRSAAAATETHARRRHHLWRTRPDPPPPPPKHTHGAAANSGGRAQIRRQLISHCTLLSNMGARQEASLEEIAEYNFAVNATFRTKEEFYQFYNYYAKGKGFGIRKDKVRKRPGTDEVVWRRYLCSCHGYRDDDYFDREDRIREPRKLTRCGCPASLVIEFSDRTGSWYVRDFVDSHD